MEPRKFFYYMSLFKCNATLVPSPCSFLIEAETVFPNVPLRETLNFAAEMLFSHEEILVLRLGVEAKLNDLPPRPDRSAP